MSADWVWWLSTVGLCVAGALYAWVVPLKDRDDREDAS